ncbi:acyltransferase [Flavobacterium piscis]|uniref:Surface polysaccharide O-acyltransferase-like enzyme n=1 Tax=Flavobacterium piscis TaxID=1114874 RepID=A0ABU1YB03_9FLAO|nr:acyltransferase [Flavobacterium piscis]MDR7211424.1 surface polysaccharide O-acyltransferase-like enzyme [Flavobacterium piscis]
MSTAIPSLNQDFDSSNKLFYIDTIKVLLTILVVLHHTFIAYGSSEGWYYNEQTTLIGARIPITMFVGINQSFFMGCFFMLAAYFTGSSFSRKGTSKFIKDRLVRLGIPMVFYSFILSPFISYLVYYFAKEQHITYLEYLSGYDSWIDLGVTWFLAALLLFTLIYVAIKKTCKLSFKKTLAAPDSRIILLFALALGVISFVVRVVFPVGWILEPIGFQPGHFPQYIALFIIGLLAAKNNWFDTLSDKTGKQLKISAWFCLLFFPVFFIIKFKLDTPTSWFSGGYHWQALLYAVWEQWIGISILTALLIKGKRSWNTSSVLLAKLSRSSFAVYIFHPLVIVGFTLAVRNWVAEPAIKLLVVAPLIVISSFVLGSLVLLIPGVKKII